MDPIATASSHNSGGNGSINAPHASQAALQVPGTLVPIYAADVTGVVARPESILSTYHALAPGASSDALMRQALGASFVTLEGAGCFATYAGIFAATVAPANGTSLAPMTASLQQLLTATGLACGHYDKLTMLLTLLGYPGLIPPDAPVGAPAKPTMHFAVWLANAPINIGVHSQLVVSNVLDSAYLLLDPMYAFAMRLPYAGGYPKASLSVLQNAAALLQTPSATGDFVDLWPGNNVVSRSQVVQAMTTGVMGPEYISFDDLSGSIGWDLQMATVLDNMA
jgi:hypothetical protein